MNLISMDCFFQWMSIKNYEFCNGVQVFFIETALLNSMNGAIKIVGLGDLTTIHNQLKINTVLNF
jgi:hypothetical protein